VRYRLMIAGVLMGALYGWQAAVQNQNPYWLPDGSADPSAGIASAWGWRPSAVWLPSYLLCVVPRNGYGIAWTRSGYLFRSDADRVRYTTASILIGAGMGVAISGLVVLSLRLRSRGSSAHSR
jgi:hypothetical protein